MAPTWPTDIRKRVRAARGYAGYSLDDLAGKVGMGRQTIFRLESGERACKEMELREIARVCGLPFEFFTANWAAVQPSTIEARLDGFADQLDAIEAALAIPRDESALSPQSEQGLRRTGTNGTTQEGH
jgi:transcriptional regulator with XRE-family HTH domain